ncbi:hypothetical protein bpSLO_001293 (plasmid) [Borrelia parkeri]|uniref:hypothetical protein n=1 Tax=Borrelia parkeri TaxID=141 RepID=UPI001FF20604|nr:hypothetical protein [Borrelia parkeri]UPA11440.1 hypothetical protein bpSLO_001293 [Borrelia parkeri]
MVRINMMFLIVLIISCEHNTKIREEESLVSKLFGARSNKMVIESKRPIPPSPPVIPLPPPVIPLPPPVIPPPPPVIPPSPPVIPPSPPVIPPSPPVIPPSPPVIPPSPPVIPPSPPVIPPSPPVIPPSSEQKDIIAKIDFNGCLDFLVEKKATTKKGALKQFYDEIIDLYSSKKLIKGHEPINMEGEGSPFLVFNEIFDAKRWYYRFNEEIIYASMGYDPDLIYALAFAIHTMCPFLRVSKSAYNSVDASEKRDRYRPAIEGLLYMLGRMSFPTLDILFKGFRIPNDPFKYRFIFDKYSTMEEVLNLRQKISEYNSMLDCASYKILVLRNGVDLSKENMTAENFYNIFNALINSKNSNDAVTEVEKRGEEIRDLLKKVLDRGKKLEEKLEEEEGDEGEE